LQRIPNGGTMEFIETVLIVGSGAREHAMVKALMRCDRPLCMHAYPGNPGMENDGCTIVSEQINGWQDLAFWAVKNEIDLTIVGPELPLVDGITDIFNKHGLSIFGPSKKAAQIEGSKPFAKELMKKYKIPTASFQIFSEKAAASRYIKEHGAPIVVKVSGLAAGKGAYVCDTIKEAEEALHDIFDKKHFGEAGNVVVIEEKMEGEEASVFVLSDGKFYIVLPVSQDYKRVGDGDAGPNTGGMGSYAPSVYVDKAMLARIEKEIIAPTLDAMRNEGMPYAGLLYIGIMLTKRGPRVVEYNCRFGDPESQSVFPLVNCDWFEAFKACSSGPGKLSSVKWSIRPGYCVSVVLASKGYPGKYEKGKMISGIEKAEAERNDVDVYLAGTKRNERGDVMTNGGRVLTVSAWEETLAEAIATVYEAVDKIEFEGKLFRRDIAAKGLARLKSS
jgi:phosphoribosylamine--glycine ligase